MKLPQAGLKILASLVLAVGVAACTPTAPPQPTPSSAAAPETTQLDSTPKRATLKVGLASNGKTYLPLYVAADRTDQEEGLEIELVALQGGSALIQALVGGSVDVGVVGLNGVVNAINAGQPLKAFYTGTTLGDYQWFGRGSVRTWEDLRGKTLGVTGAGSLTDQLSRVILKKHGLEPERDVQIIPVGAPPTALQALMAERVDAAVLTNPTAWNAEDEGFHRLGSLATELVDEYPQSVLVAKEQLIAEEPETLRALLRAQARAIKLIQSDRTVASDALVKNVRFEQADADRTYEEVVPKLNLRGELPARAMPLFWQVALLAGDSTEELPEARYFDRQFVDTFDQWAPK